jgi:predicted RNA-binding protein associated with RNAse of E/G family
MRSTEADTSMDPGGPAARVEVVLTKRGRTKISYPAELLGDDGTLIVVRAPFAGGTVRDFGFVRFEPGDVFTEFYRRDRWYAVKEIRDAAGVLKGWYCDIARPAVRTAGRLVVEDLDLDLWRSADGTDVLRLDEDEFAESGLTESDPEAASAAVAALDELEALAHAGRFGELLR